MNSPLVQLIVTRDQAHVIVSALLRERDRLLRESRSNDRASAKAKLAERAAQIDELQSAIVFKVDGLLTSNP